MCIPKVLRVIGEEDGEPGSCLFLISGIYYMFKLNKLLIVDLKIAKNVKKIKFVPLIFEKKNFFSFR